MKKFSLWFVVLAALAACAGGSGGPVGSVEKYIHALAEQDADALTAVSCAAWEADALMELDSFAAVSAEVEGLSCKESGVDGDVTLVACEGRLVLDYNGEMQELNLAKLTYRVIEEGGEWRMCGH